MQDKGVNQNLDFPIETSALDAEVARHDWCWTYKGPEELTQPCLPF